MTDGPIIDLPLPRWSGYRGISGTVRALLPLWRSVLCFVLGVTLILSGGWCSAVVLSGDRAGFILVVWTVVGAYLIVRAFKSLHTTGAHRDRERNKPPALVAGR